MTTLVVYGATGFTGTQVVQELDRRGECFAIAGRNRAKLEALSASVASRPEVRVAAVRDPAALAQAFRGAKAVINTAGPFTDLGEEIVVAALTAGCHYVDTTGEQAYIRQMSVRYDALAKKQEVVLCTAMAYEYALGECAAFIACQALPGQVELLETFYRTSGGVSRGTAKSIIRAVSGETVAWRDGRLEAERTGSRRTEIRLIGDDKPRTAASFGGGMPLHAGSYGDVLEARSYLVLPERAIRNIRRLGRTAGVLRFAPLRAMLDWAIDRKVPAEGPGPGKRFLVAARAQGGGQEVQVCVHGTDAYAITAVVAVEGALRLREGENKACGALSAPLALDPEKLLGALEAFGVKVERRHGA